MNHQTPEDFLKQFGSFEYLNGHGPLGDDPPLPDFEATEEEHQHKPPAPKKAEAQLEHKKMRIIDPRGLAGKPVPERQWIVPDWVPVGYTTAVYGDGGTGKTLLAQQLMTSCATGTPWLGLAVMPCKVFGLFCEDDEEELHRRQDAINRNSDLSFSDLGDMRWVSGVGADNLLMSFSGDGRALRAARLHDLTEAALQFEAKLVVIDTAADTFGGNENDRSQVRQFIGAALNRLARDIGGAVLLNCHPSRSGLSPTGDTDGGSTGWSNTVRSRLSLTRPKGDDGEPADTDERILGRRKANYASIGTEIKLRYISGILAHVQVSGAIGGTINRAAVEATFLALLEENQKQGRHVSDSRSSTNFAPKIFGKSPNRKGCTKIDFERAMESLFAIGTIVVEEYGRPGDRHKHLALASKNGGEAGEE